MGTKTVDSPLYYPSDSFIFPGLIPSVSPQHFLNEDKSPRITYRKVAIIHGGKNNDRSPPRVLLNPRGKNFSFYRVEVFLGNRKVA